MNRAQLRMVFAGAFGLIALVGAIVLEVSGHGVEAWLAGVIGMAAGYLFGHVQENGFSGTRHHE